MSADLYYCSTGQFVVVVVAQPKEDLLWARVAQWRVQADQIAQPRQAIKYMVETWPQEFVSASAATSKVNKARRFLRRVDGRWALTAEAERILNGVKK